MYLVDEQDDAALGFAHFLDYGLESLFKLAFVLCSGDQRTHVERIDGLVQQVLRHVAADNSLCQSLGYGRFSHTRFSDKDRVVLGTAGKDLQHAPDFLVPADDRIEFVLAGQFIEVLGVLLERLISVLLVLFGHPVALAKILDGGTQVFLLDVVLAEQFGRFILPAHHGQYEVFDRNELVVHLGGDALSLRQHFGSVAGKVHLASRHFRKRVEDDPHLPVKVFGVHADLAQQERQYAAVRIEDTLQDVRVLDLGIAPLGRNHLGLLYGLLRFGSEIVEIHICLGFIYLLFVFVCLLVRKSRAEVKDCHFFRKKDKKVKEKTSPPPF